MLWVGLLIAIVFVIYFIGVLAFAIRNPGAALLEGAQFLSWQRMQMASKEVGTLPLLPGISDPVRPALPPASPEEATDEEPQ